MSPTVTVVVPSYNDAAMLEQCLTALDAQTRPPDELIVVDNGSSDTTVEVAVRHGARVVTELRRGIPQATAAGFDAATSEVIGRLDADSVPPPDWVARIARAFAIEPGLEVLSGPGEFIDGRPFPRWFAANVHMPLYFGPVAWLLGHDVVYGSNLALRRTTWLSIRERIHRWDREMHDDLDIALNLPPGTGIRFDDSLVVGVSNRLWGSWPRFLRGCRMAFYTFAVNHDEVSLLARRRAWLNARPDEQDDPLKASA